MQCSICPRGCHVDRDQFNGYCSAGSLPRTGRIALHFYEEPPISGTRGSGAVFFTGCNLHCVFCQNHALRDGGQGRLQTAESLANAYLSLEAQGAHNINLVTPAPHVPVIAESLRSAKSMGLSIPVVYNTNGYELPETLRSLEGLVDVYLPDFKYMTPALSARFSGAENYAEIAEAAVLEMYRQVSHLTLDAEGIAIKGLLVRHLVLPECVFDTRLVLRKLFDLFGSAIHLSLMSQYAPTDQCKEPPLNRTLTKREYDRALDYAISLGFEHIFMQDLSAASLDYTPLFPDM